MRTSFDLSDHLLELARSRATAQRTSVKALVEEGLRRVLEQPVQRLSEPGIAYQVPTVGGAGGIADGVDATDSSALLEKSEPGPRAPRTTTKPPGKARR